VSASALRDAASHVFESWHPVALSPLDGVKEEQQAPQACLVRNSASQVDLQLAFRGFPRSSPQIMHLRLMRRILAGGGSSRLFLTLRERLGLIYAVDAAISAYEESGLFAIDLTCSPDNLEAVVETTLGELLTLARDVMAKEELDRYCQGYNFDLEYSSDSPYEMQVRFGWGELVGFVRDIDEDRQSAGALTPAEIRETAAILFAPQRLNLVAVGPLTVKARRKVERLVAGYEKLWQKEFSSTP
jgi:predicted Zn-dependent peptidase